MQICNLLFYILPIILVDILQINALVKENEIEIKPGSNNYKLKFEKIECTFKCAVLGGTGERWIFKIQNENNGVTCQVSRNTPTYLVFSNFNLHMTGAKPTAAYLLNGDKSIDDQFVFNLAKSIVNDSPKFKKQLTLVALTTISDKEL